MDNTTNSQKSGEFQNSNAPCRLMPTLANPERWHIQPWGRSTPISAHYTSPSSCYPARTQHQSRSMYKTSQNYKTHQNTTSIFYTAGQQFSILILVSRGTKWRLVFPIASMSSITLRKKLPTLARAEMRIYSGQNYHVQFPLVQFAVNTSYQVAANRWLFANFMNMWTCNSLRGEPCLVLDQRNGGFHDAASSS